MDKEIIQLLKSSNPDDRIEGINRLSESGHPDSIKILGALYKKETDPGVKQLVAQVARQMKEGGAAVSSAGTQSASRHDPVAAKAHLERAMDAMIEFKNDEAWLYAKKAFQANPELADDDYALGLVAEITGSDRTMAVETLLAGGGGPAMSEKPKRSEKAKISSGAERVGWGKALAGIGVYSLIVALGISIPFGILGSALTAIMAFADPSLAGATGGTVAMIAGIMGISTIIAVFIGVFIQYGLIHFSATTFLGGDGYFTNLLWNMRIPLIAQFFVQVLIFGIMIFMMFSAFANIDTAAIEAAMATGDASYIPGIEDNFGTLQALNGLNGLISLGFTVWISIVIGKTYDFGGIKGCLSIIISSIVMTVAVCGCYFAVFMIFASSIDTSSFQ